jgi:hypothetical protein|tara:strand:- start:953 stop:1162 length:210 start_codon:yes stop_codon:yes gene_type:complete
MNIKNKTTKRIDNIQDRINWLLNNSINWHESLQHPVEATRFLAQHCIDKNTNEINRLQKELSSLTRRSA